MDPEIIDISTMHLNDDSSKSWNSSSNIQLKSSNFGGGIELLMNDKREKNSGSSSGDINIDDLTNLENELNDLVDDSESGPGRTTYENKSDIFSVKSPSFDNDRHSVRFDEGPGINIGQATAANDGDEKTWDGYGKFQNIPLNPDKPVPQQPQMSKDELLREKFKFLRKLEGLEGKGVNLTKKYSMESPLAEMQGEYEMIMEEKTKSNSVKFQGNMLMAAINAIEFLNNRFDPFDIKLDGWSEQINENMNDYDDVFAELFDKYKSRATMAPELKLLFQLGGSAMMVHMTNTMFKSAMPGMDDILRQNPDLMRQFQTAAVNTMGQTSPGFSGFMNGLMNPEANNGMSSGMASGMAGPSMSTSRGGPPAPMATHGPGSAPAPTTRPGNNNYGNANRPDLVRGRGFTENDGINIRESFGNASTAERSQRTTNQKSVNMNANARPEMKGPSDITDILSGLKTKTINIQEASPMMDGNSSTISISDLKELQGDLNMPKRSKRRQKSDKNTVSIDI